MSDVDAMIRAREARSPGFKAMVDGEMAELRVGLIVKDLRQKSGMTQEELAHRIKTTKSAVSRLENSTGGVRLDTLEKVAHAFGKELVIEFR
jgi:HTH-type transcriptional regulator/antitoxin HipB